MTAEEFKKQDGIEASSFDNQMRNWSYTESQLTAFAERYHTAKLKLLGIADVSGHVPEDIQTFLHRIRLAEHPEIRKEAIALFERHCR